MSNFFLNNDSISHLQYHNFSQSHTTESDVKRDGTCSPKIICKKNHFFFNFPINEADNNVNIKTRFLQNIWIKIILNIVDFRNP